MKENKTYRKMLGRMKKNPAITLIVAFIVIALGFTYLPQLTAQFSGGSSEAFGVINPGLGDPDVGTLDGPSKPYLSLPGKLVFSKSASTPLTGSIAAADEQLLAVWNAAVINHPNSIAINDRIRIVKFSVRGDLSENSGSSLTYADLTNAVLVDMATGNALAIPVDGIDGGGTVGTAGIDPMFVFSNTFVLETGTTQIGFKVDLGTDWADGDTIQVQLYQASDFIVKSIPTNDTIIPTGFTAVGNKMTVKDSALDVCTLGNPPSGDIVIGTTDFTWSSFVFDATESGEDILVTAVTVTDTFDGIYGDMADIDNAEIWMDFDNNGTYETKIAGTDTPIGGGGATDTHTFIFNQTITVPKSQNIGWIMVGDLAFDAIPGGTHAITVSANGAFATGAETGAAITNTASGTAGTLTVASTGFLGLAVDGSSPSSSIVLAGTSDNMVAKFKITAVDEGFTLTKINILLADWGLSLDQWDSISVLTIEYPLKTGGIGTKSLTPSTTTAIFDNINMYVAKNDSAILTVKASFANIATESADHGDQIEIGFDYDGITAVGDDSGTIVTTAGSANVTAKTQLLMKTLVTVTKDTAGLSTTLVAGTSNTLYKWKMTVDSAGPIGLKRLTFNVGVTDNTNSSNTVNIGGFTIIKNSVDITTSDVLIAGLGGLNGNQTNDGVVARVSMETKGINDIGGIGTGSGSLGTTNTWIHVMFGDNAVSSNQPETGELSLPAGSTSTWILNGITGTGFVGAEDDSVSAELLGDTTASTDGYFDIVDYDITNDEYSIVLANTFGTPDVSDVEFIWTDFSAISHTGAMADNEGTPDTTPDSSSDWANGWLIKNFPLGAWSLIA